VILKASEVCPRTHSLIIESFIEAGFTGGIVNLITNAPKDAGDIVGALIDHKAVKRINFTGSTEVGRIVAVRAAQNLKPVLLELGGKAPLLVLDDADLDEAVRAAAFGAFMNQGQICMSTERIIVMESIADVFAEKFKAKAASMATGNPREGKTPLGAVIDLKAVRHVEALVDDAVQRGAARITGGRSSGVLMPATVIDNVTPAIAKKVSVRWWPSFARATRSTPLNWRMTRTTACPPPYSPRTPRAACASRSKSSPACATSTGRPSTTKRRCRLAALKPQAMGALAARPVSMPLPSFAGSPLKLSPAIFRSEVLLPREL
jgi:hypothetical protein